MSQKLINKKELLSPPGDDILEHIEYIKMSQAELADRLGKTPSKVNDIISGKEPITYATALQLEKVLGIQANYWLQREMLFREKQSRIEQEEAMAHAESWAKQHPLKELKKCGYIKQDKPGQNIVGEILEFYCVVNQERWRTRYVDEYVTAQYRKSSSHQMTLISIAAWLRMGELELQKTQMPDYNSSLFRKALVEIKDLVRIQPIDFAHQLQALCAKAGVAVIYTMCLPKAPVSGATRWFRNRPLIQLTDRHKTNDHFWFTFFHEAGHVLLHGRKDIFLEEFEGYKPNKMKEEEANRFAMKWLLPEKAIEEQTINFTDKYILSISRLYDTHPGIVVGRLQWLGWLKHHQGNKHKVSIRLF